MGGLGATAVHAEGCGEECAVSEGEVEGIFTLAGGEEERGSGVVEGEEEREGMGGGPPLRDLRVEGRVRGRRESEGGLEVRICTGSSEVRSGSKSIVFLLSNFSRCYYCWYLKYFFRGRYELRRG
jgi:hypothetical protein